MKKVLSLVSTTHLFRTGFLVLFAGLIILSCAQDSLFYNISIEPEPKDPRIPGTPTNMAVVNSRVYVGTRMSKKINYYYYDPVASRTKWGSMSSPGGSLIDLASDGTYLFALVFPGGSPRRSVIKRYNFTSADWDEEISSGDYSIHSLYSAGGEIFAGGQNKSNYLKYAILHCDSDLSSFDATTETGNALLTGAAEAGGDIYLATSGSGIFKFDGSDITPLVDAASGKNITGIIETGGVIVAVSDGTVYSDLETPGTFTAYSSGGNFSGAMCVWKEYDGATWVPKLLLLGINGEGTSTNLGYRELELEDTGGKPRAAALIKSPGNSSPTTVIKNSKYSASIGKHPVEAILQIPDELDNGPLKYDDSIADDPDWQPPIFASTVKNGLWSYVYKDDQWNAE